MERAKSADVAPETVVQRGRYNVESCAVGADRGPDLAGRDDRAFDVQRVDPQIGDQRLGEPFDREFRGRCRLRLRS